jgi:hypothetical protein
MQIDALMADSHLACNLLVAQLNAHIEIHIGLDLGIYTAGITVALGSLRSLGAGLFGAIGTVTSAKAEFAADGAAAPAK